MLTKLLLTASVVILAWLVVRDRWRSDGDGAAGRAQGEGGARGSRAARAEALMPRGAVKLAAYGLVVLMLVGTGVYLVQGWQQDREVVRVQVINAYTGQTEAYLARRGAIEARRFETLDGRLVQVAEMERLVLSEASR
jgi:hypothetical protein